MTARSTVPPRLVWSSLIFLGGAVAQALSSQTILTSQLTATSFVSGELWQGVVEFLGGQLRHDPSGIATAEVGFLPLLAVWLLIAGVGWLLAARLIRRHHQSSWQDSLALSGFALGWWWLMGVWELALLLAFAIGWESLEQLLLVTPQFWQAMALAGWLVHPFAVSPRRSGEWGVGSGEQGHNQNNAAVQPSHSPLPTPHSPLFSTFVSRHSSLKSVAVLIAIYIVVFTAMNWRLWFNLRIPHGDSAMYEEHLWNLWHGKGFRSYLDQGLFLGEHIQVIHLLLLPLHLVWPSHLLMELCESTALALGAIPIFRMTQRSTGSARAGLLMSAAYLLYFPLHFLDIEVDLKTFRPESFCVPFFLFAFEALEEGRWRRMLVLLAFALSAKEDYSIIIAPLGVWIAATAWLQARPALGAGLVIPTALGAGLPTPPLVTTAGLPPPNGDLRSIPAAGSGDPRRALLSGDPRRARFIVGLSLAVFGVVYLLLAILVVIPWFRSGAELHYVRYFPKFGSSMGEVAKNMLMNPSLLFSELLTAKTALYALAMLLPVGFIALLSPSRLAVGLPLFGILCLNELAADPRHHFHAPLVPIVFWATAIGVGNAGRVFGKLRSLISPSPHLPISPSQTADSFARQFVWASAFTSGLFLSLSPAGIGFWDAGSSMSLWRLYAHDPRADHFPKVLAKIPHESRVASTDFVHPRFTHHARSYDYSKVLRRVANYEDRVPDDTDFIVIDARGPYSGIKSPDQVRELQTAPDRWEVLPDETDGYFIVLRRK